MIIKKPCNSDYYFYIYTNTLNIMARYILLLFVANFIFSCRTIAINHKPQVLTSQSLQLGAIGEQKRFLLEYDYYHTALPNYQQPIKLQVTNTKFNTASYKAFTKAKIKQTSNVNIIYSDTLQNKPKYVKLDFLDRIAILNSLNSKENLEVFKYLKNKNNAHIITGIALALTPTNMEALEIADEVFLENFGIKNYVLATYKDKERLSTIKFTDGIVFAYQTSSFCWKQDEKYKLKIADLVNYGGKCVNKTYNYSKRAEKEINYYKF